MAYYARQTDVSPDRSRLEIERTLRRYGAERIASFWEDSRSGIGFQMRGRMIRLVLPMPSRAEFRLTPQGRDRCENAIQACYDQAVRQRWRALLLVIKAKLEAVESGICSFEEEFLANTLLPGGQTVGELALPKVEQAYLTGNTRAIALLEWKERE